MIYDLKTFRIANGLTQQELADALGLKKSAVSMIESGKREIPEAARQKLFQLQQQPSATNTTPAVRAEPFYKTFKAKHYQQSTEYIKMYIGDLQSEKHRLEKHIKSWTSKFNAAGMVLKEAEILLTLVEQKKIEYAAAIPDLLARKHNAEEQLREITRQKPEIALIRLEGIKKELAAAKALLAKRQRFPILDTVSSAFGVADTTKKIGAPVSRKQLPDAE